METTKGLPKSIFKTKKAIRKTKKIYFIISDVSNATLFFFGVYFVNDLINRAEKCSIKEAIMVVAIIVIIGSMYIISRIECKLMGDACKDMEKLIDKQENNNINK